MKSFSSFALFVTLFLIANSLKIKLQQEDAPLVEDKITYADDPLVTESVRKPARRQPMGGKQYGRMLGKMLDRGTTARDVTFNGPIINNGFVYPKGAANPEEILKGMKEIAEKNERIQEQRKRRWQQRKAKMEKPEDNLVQGPTFDAKSLLEKKSFMETEPITKLSHNQVLAKLRQQMMAQRNSFLQNKGTPINELTHEELLAKINQQKAKRANSFMENKMKK